MANGGLKASIKNASANVAAAKAPTMKGAATVGAAVVNARKGNRGAISMEAARRLWSIIASAAGQKGKLVAALLKSAPVRLKTVAQKYKITAVGMAFGFEDDDKFLKYLALRIEAMKQRDDSAAEFLSGTLGRQNAFLGSLLELCLKYGPLREVLLGLTDRARNVINKDIDASLAGGRSYQMRNANNAAVGVNQKFSAPLMANLLEVETADGPKAFVDFAGISFNKPGQWSFPLPIEIKMPRAASGVGAQMATMVERLSAAIADGKKVFAYFSADDIPALEKLVGKAAIVGTELRDGRQMAKVVLDPKQALFNADDIYGSLSRNQTLVRPDSRYWNPADPTKVPAAAAQKIFSIGEYNGREVSVEMSASSAISGKKQGFNFWRVLVPVERAFLVDVYRAIFAVDR